MSFLSTIERITDALQQCTPEDASSLAGLLAEIQALRNDWKSEGPDGMESEPDAALALAEGLLRKKSEAPGDDLAAIKDFVSKVRSAVGADAPTAGAAEDIDDELLQLFLGGCEEALSKIEGGLIELGENPGRTEVWAEVRGVIHTLKGECGVIPLAEAQEVFHEAENLLDTCSTQDIPIPIDNLLVALDWFKSYTEQLASDQSTQPPPHAEVMEKLRMTSSCVDAEAAESVDEGETITFPDDVMNDPTLPEFVVEARGHLEDAEAALLDVESHPEDLEIINRIFRTFHTIKGVAGFMNMTAMVELAHSTEALLDEFRKSNLTCSEEHTTLIFSCCDAMSSMLDFLTGGEAPRTSLIRKLVESTSLAARGEPWDGGSSQAAPAPVATPEAAAPQSAPAPAPEASAESAAEPSAPQPAPAASEAKPAPAETPKDTIKPPAAPAKTGLPAKKKYRLDNTVKVGTTRLDALVDMVGELVIAQAGLTQDPNLASVRTPRLQRNLTQVGKITRDLQESAMSLRMVTLKSTFQKMSRLVRDVAQKSGKSVSFSTLGDDTELDRTVVEEISDPLVHLIRNSIDHGLETPDERVEAGKPTKGSVELRAYHQGGSIVIEIRDDGRAASKQKIFKKALERGILPPETKLEEMPENEVHKLIFQPGFSTAEQVTDISGRGVGMDVVRRNIEKMRGKIDISSTEGEGTSIYLRLPLTLAIIDGMIVRCGGSRYVLPTLAIEMSFRPNPDQIHPLLTEGEMVDVRGMMLPVHRLKNIFNLDEGTDDLEEGILILLEDNGARINLFVDEIIGQQQVVIKNLGKALPAIPCISGGAILGDGRVALILDIDALLLEVGQPTA